MVTIFRAIAKSLEITGVTVEKTTLLPTQVSYTKNGEKAKQVVAEPLTKIPGNTHGSSPGSSVPVGWEKIEPDLRSKYWVRAHLLNHHLHGPGKEWNLFPAHKNINSDMESKIEGPAKKAVAKNDNKFYFYEANLTYGASEFPSSFKVEFGEYDADSKKRKAASHIYEVSSLEIPQSYTVNINTDSTQRLKEVAKANNVTGMSTFFDNLVKERIKNEFESIKDIERRMSNTHNIKAKILELNKLIIKNKLQKL